MSKRRIADEAYRLILRLQDREFAALTIKRLADLLGVSRCHLSRSFHCDKKLTLAQFIQRQKLIRAERCLADKQPITVKQLASQMGFADYQYFIARFKEHWGESPGRYRKIVMASSRSPAVDAEADM